MSCRMTLAVAAALAAACILTSCARGPVPVQGLFGTVLPQPGIAADFTLSDQHGLPFHLAEAKGKVVVLTFLYTHCTDICPFISLKVREAGTLLGDDVDKVVFVGITTDPARDTEAVIAAYSAAAGLIDKWHFLTGSEADLRTVWKGYGIGVRVVTPDDEPAAPSGGLAEEPAPTEGLSPAEVDEAGVLIDRFGGGYEVSHSAPFWVIDTRGYVRVVLDASARPDELAADARLLLAAR
jgi:cytochrome oxidase Cu insertion factor (SCO1/SenC/PrrC family)